MTSPRDSIVRLGKSEQDLADIFLKAGALQKEYEKQRKAAKDLLLLAMGDHSDGLLPDGRRVSQTIAHFQEATFTRAAYDATTLTVSALSASDVAEELAKLIPPTKHNSTLRDGSKLKAKAKSSAPPKARVGK